MVDPSRHGGAEVDPRDTDEDALLQAMNEDRLEEVGQDHDVRQVMAELRASGRQMPDDVEWHRFHHAYGQADDVPALLHSLSDPDPERASRNLNELWNKVRHQGGSSAPAALAVPFLIRIAADSATHHRSQVLLLAAEAGRRNHFGRDLREGLLQAADAAEEMWFDVAGFPVGWTLQAAREAVTADAPLLIRLLEDTDPAVRAHAAYALAAALSPPPRVLAALRARLPDEDEPSVRASLILALTQLAMEHEDPTIAAWTEQLWADEDNLPDIRFAAALGWMCATTAPVPERMLDLFTAVVMPATERWMQHVPWPDDIARHGGLAAWLVAFLGDVPDIQARLAARLTASSHPTVTASALNAAYDLACTWRPYTDDMIDLLAGQLNHVDPAVSRTAARHLAEAGAVPASIANRIAATLDHHDHEVRAWVTVALAHSGDPRAVAPLTELLSRPVYPWPRPYRGPERIAPPQQLLNSLRPYAEHLLPAVLLRLVDTSHNDWRYIQHNLLDGLGHWGAQAAPAVGTLIGLLSRPDVNHRTVATVLGRIGPAAADAAPVLDRLITDASPEDIGVLVWSRWRVTGEQTAHTAATLARLATVPPHGPKSLRLLADLGPTAATHESTVRSLLTATYFWTRAEAAYALWRGTGDAADTVPILLRILADRRHPAQFDLVHATITGYLTQIGPPAEGATTTLTDFLRAERRAPGLTDSFGPISWDQHCQLLAMTALEHIRPAQR